MTESRDVWRLRKDGSPLVMWDLRWARDKRPDRSWCHRHTSVKLFWMDVGGSIRVCCRSIHGSITATKKAYTSVAVTPAPVRDPIQQPLVSSFTSVVVQARTFHLALTYTHTIFMYTMSHPDGNHHKIA